MEPSMHILESSKTSLQDAHFVGMMDQQIALSAQLWWLNISSKEHLPKVEDDGGYERIPETSTRERNYSEAGGTAVQHHSNLMYLISVLNNVSL